MCFLFLFCSLISKKGSDIPDGKSLFLKAIISGEFDADRADYLLRDSYFCGVKYGEYDYKRYISSFKIKDLVPLSFTISADDVPMVEEFLLARYHYNLQVPFHRTRVGYDMALEHFIENRKRKEVKGSSLFEEVEKNIVIENDEIKEINLEWFNDFDDYSIFDDIKNVSEPDFWTKCLKRETHLVMIAEKLCIKPADIHRHKKILRRLEDERLKNDYFSWENKFKMHKLSDSGSDEKPQYYVEDRRALFREVYLEEYSPIFNSFVNNTPWMWRIYSKPDLSEKILEIIRGLDL